MKKKKNIILAATSQSAKTSSLNIQDILEETAAEVRVAEDSRKFNHFVETGEVLPDTPDSTRKTYLEALDQITSLVRPGPLTSVFQELIPPKKI